MNSYKNNVIIRTRDLKKTKKSWSRFYLFESYIYHRVEFEPITKQSIEKHLVELALKGKFCRFDREVPEHYLMLCHPFLHNRKYINWKLAFDDSGVLTVQSRSKYEPDVLGWAVFERDLE